MQGENAFVVQGRVLFALIVREMTTRYGRNPGGYVWAILEPLGMVTLLSFVFSFIARKPPLGENFPLFFATGYMAFHYYTDISRQLGMAVLANRPLLTFPRVTILDTILSRFVLQFLTVSFVFFVIASGLLTYIGDPVQIDFRALAVAIGLGSFLGFAVGMLNSVLFCYSSVYQTMFTIFSRPLFLISGVFFLYEDLPAFAQRLIWWNPLIHVTSIMREAFYPHYSADFVSPIYVGIFACVPLMTAILLLRLLRNSMLEQ